MPREAVASPDPTTGAQQSRDARLAHTSDLTG
jgi:hypothetical protein